MERKYNHLRDNSALYFTLMSILGAGLCMDKTIDSLVRGDYKAVIGWGLADLVNIVPAIICYRYAKEEAKSKEANKN